MYRVLTVIGLIVAAAALPPPPTIAAALVAMFVFKRFWEALAVGIFLDALFAVPEPRWLGFQFIYTALLTAAFVVIEISKKHLRFYN